MLVTRPRSIFAHVGRLLITELLPILIWPIFTRFLSPIRLPTLLPTLLPMPLPTFGRLGSVLAMPLSIPGLTVLGRVEGFSGLSIPRKSPRSPADGRPPPPPGRIGRPPAPGRLTLGSLVFGWFAVPPSPGMLGRVAGLGNLLPKPITCPGKLFPGRVVGRVLGREGSAVGGEGRVDGFKPPDGRLTCGWFGVVDRVVGRFTAGRLTFGAVMFGRVGVGLLGAGRLGAGRLGAGLPAPRLGTLGRAAGRAPPPPMLRAATPPPPPPPRKPRAESSPGDSTSIAVSAKALNVNNFIVQCPSRLVLWSRCGSCFRYNARNFYSWFRW